MNRLNFQQAIQIELRKFGTLEKVYIFRQQYDAFVKELARPG